MILFPLPFTSSSSYHVTPLLFKFLASFYLIVAVYPTLDKHSPVILFISSLYILITALRPCPSSHSSSPPLPHLLL